MSSDRTVRVVVMKIHRDDYLGEPFRTLVKDINAAWEAIPDDLVGATYLFEDASGKAYAFSIKMTQAKDPQETGSFGLWFGPLDAPAISERVKAVNGLLNTHAQPV